MIKKIEVPSWSTIDDAVNMLLAAKQRGEHVYCKFSGYDLYSDTITLDGAYKLIMKCTKKEYCEQMKTMIENGKKSLQLVKNE